MGPRPELGGLSAGPRWQRFTEFIDRRRSDFRFRFLVLGAAFVLLDMVPGPLIEYAVSEHRREWGLHLHPDGRSGRADDALRRGQGTPRGILTLRAVSVDDGILVRVQTMSASVARRTALAAQGFADPLPGAEVTRRHLRRALARTKLLQLDSVNVAVRAHYMPLFSRLGPYSRDLVDAAAWSHQAKRPRMLVEYWAHEASLIPVADWPLLRWRMRAYGGAWRAKDRALLDRTPELLDDVLAAVKELGPVGAGTLERELGSDQRQSRGPWWDRSDTKRACELLFAMGELTTGARKGFERLYDLPERVLPPDVLADEPEDEDAIRGLVERSAEALGVATEPDLRDYYRLSPSQSKQAVAELVEAQVLEPVAVQGWQQPAYRHVNARAPRKVTGRALLCPFDPLVWERARAERIFGFRYRIEIYVPGPKREFGYYVFPFLLNGELAARVDLKADRAAGVLRVPGAFAEAGRDVASLLPELGAALEDMSRWLGLGEVVVGDRGDLAKPLRSLLR